MQSVNDETFEAEVLNYEGIVMVDFWAPWCAPCRQLSPIIQQVGDDNADLGVKVVKLDADEAPEVTTRYGIDSLPSIIIFKDGNPVERLIGLQTAGRLQQCINEAQAYWQ